ncbi:MAG: cell division protein FtsL [Spirochaetes bacterium]|nr:cell division protein FtsL [Spirochaetota bacterium]
MLLKEEEKENKDVFKVFIQFTLWTFLFIALIFIYIWQSIATSDLEYKLNRMDKRIKVLSKEQQKLETEISFLSSPERIGEIAEKQLKLVPVRQEDIIWIDYQDQSRRFVKKTKDHK